MDETRSRDSIRKAASDAMKAGGDIGRRVRDLTLESLANRRFDREGIREVVRAVTEGMAAAAPASGGSMRQAMGQAFRGMAGFHHGEGSVTARRHQDGFSAAMRAITRSSKSAETARGSH